MKSPEPMEGLRRGCAGGGTKLSGMAETGAGDASVGLGTVCPKKLPVDPNAEEGCRVCARRWWTWCVGTKLNMLPVAAAVGDTWCTNAAAGVACGMAPKEKAGVGCGCACTPMAKGRPVLGDSAVLAIMPDACATVAFCAMEAASFARRSASWTRLS